MLVSCSIKFPRDALCSQAAYKTIRTISATSASIAVPNEEEDNQKPSIAAVLSDNTCESEQLRRRFSNAVLTLFRTNYNLCKPEIKTHAAGSCTIPHPPPAAYNKMMKAFSKAGKLNEVIRLFHEMRSYHIIHCYDTVILCYNTLMNALVISNHGKQARAVFKVIISLIGSVNVSSFSMIMSSFNIIIKMHCILEQFDLVITIMSGMTSLGFEPDSITYSTLISGYCRVGQVDKAWDVFDLMTEYRCLPTVLTFTPFVHAYCLQGSIERAKDLIPLMEQKGCPPNSVTYNVLIAGLCRSENFDEAEKVMMESELKGWKPSLDTHHTYVNGLCKWGKPKEAIERIEEMEESGLDPCIVSLNILLDSLCRDRRISEAKCSLDKSTEFKWFIGVVGYNTVISRLFGIGSWLEAMNIFADMLKKGIKPNTRTFNIVINGLCKAKKPQKAINIFKRGKRRMFVANVVTYNILIHWCYRNGEIDESLWLFSQMEVEKITPDAVTYTTMVVGLCNAQRFSEATKLLLRSFQGEIDLDLVNGLVNKLHDKRCKKQLIFLLKGTTELYLKQNFHNLQLYNICITLDEILRKYSSFS